VSFRTGQCVKDAECSPEGRCKCKPGFFVDLGRCSGSKFLKLLKGVEVLNLNENAVK
jgi:hypothetical protein